MDMTEKERCLNCKFGCDFSVTLSGVSRTVVMGECRRHTPTRRTAAGATKPIYPSVSGDDWCGDWEQIPQRLEIAADSKVKGFESSLGEYIKDVFTYINTAKKKQEEEKTPGRWTAELSVYKSGLSKPCDVFKFDCGSVLVKSIVTPLLDYVEDGSSPTYKPGEKAITIRLDDVRKVKE